MEFGDDPQFICRFVPCQRNKGDVWSRLRCVPEQAVLDPTDHAILDLLKENARRPLREIATAVGLTVAPVQRRIARLEKLGVIERYTVRINHGRIASGIEAMTELQFADDLDLAQIMEFVAQIPEVEEVLTLAGDPDALVRIQVEGVEDLRRVVSSLRSAPAIASTKTLVVLEQWTRRG
ncbi:AsnC family transcriptional regulator [Kribbella shirazensis]|uniref:DNA-binding Lrp family transcriptional regulator n=1 Tax=Kribbella shirazensis TaxID=1105143 RepID=A0A7X6A1I1_9ACTN|nr:DNA-binding Lrp family transcriptional regulator [Kribbella shirazensis]